MVDRADQRGIIEARLEEGATWEAACREAGISARQARRWKADHPEWAARVETLMERNRRRQLAEAEERRAARDPAIIFDPDRELRDKGTFAEFRWRYLGRPTPPHQEPIVRALEDRTNLVVLILCPPGAGKDTVALDWLLYEKCDDMASEIRAAWIMEAERFAKRRVGERLHPYLTDRRSYAGPPIDTPGAQTPERNLIADFGPFRWEPGMVYPNGSEVERTTFNRSEMYFVGRSVGPEADPDVWSTGVEGELYGARVQLMVVSDAFTRENQRSPVRRGDQLEWLQGTVKSRLDAGGRLIILGTRVAPYDNYGELLDRYVSGARVVRSEQWLTKFSNGVCVVSFPAIQFDDQGRERSYWPERFPLDGQLLLPGGGAVSVADLSDAEHDQLAAEPGTERLRGLREMRDEPGSLFGTMYQQQPPETVVGDFSDEVLGAADDPDRTIGVWRSGEILVLGVDPARSGGAGWVLWGVDREAETATIIDLWYGEGLGFRGIREKLVIAPVVTYPVAALQFEDNIDGGAAIEHPDVAKVLREAGVSTDLVHTGGQNRGDAQIGVASMGLHMRTRTIRFPAATAEDRRRMALLKAHFKTFDSVAQVRQTTDSYRAGHTPYDLAMAAWVGWVRVFDMLRRGRRSPSAFLEAGVNRVVAKRWRKRLAAQARRKAEEELVGDPAPEDVDKNDLLALYHAYGADR